MKVARSSSVRRYRGEDVVRLVSTKIRVLDFRVVTTRLTTN